MKKTIVVLILIACIGFSTSLLAQEKGSASPIISISQEAKEQLKTIHTIAIFLSGNDALLARIVEDALAIHLTNAGFTVINREKIEKNVGEQVAKMQKEKTEGVINALEIGTAVNADSILIGTMIIKSGEQASLSIKVASFQLVDVVHGKTLVNVLFESEKGKPFSETAKEFVDILRENMK